MSQEPNSASRLRFAPSPTGTLHVGGARTALFNWLLARHCGAKLVLRIEDTDRERSTPESVQAILDGLAWLGLDWDEGPFFQSERGERYRQAIGRLLEDGHSYRCFCTPQRLEELRTEARAAGEAFTYDGRCRRIEQAEAESRAAAGEAHTMRFKTEPGRIVEFDDLIGGKRSFEMDRLGDFVLQRSDGSPIYHLTVVVDDHEMGITHVVRGDDHLANTPRQLLIFEALGWTAPAYAHLPLIQGPDRARLSKRHGAASVMEFARDGFLPEAMFNYLALLGWSLDDETEIMTREKLIENFSLKRINSSASMFDRTKLEWMNGVYLRAMPIEEATERARVYFRENGVEESRLEDPWFQSVVALGVDRARTLKEMIETLGFFFIDSLEGYEEKGARKHLLKDASSELLSKVEEALGSARNFDAESLEPLLRGLAEKLQVSFGRLMAPLRMALTGRSASPGIFDVLLALGRERSIQRIAQARGWIGDRQTSSTGHGGGPS